MVVSVQALACLDLLIWLRTGQAAAERLATSQPSVSRRVNQVAQVFGLELVKSQGEWLVDGDAELLNRERRVHQLYRWQNDQPLRLEAQSYSGPLFCPGLSTEWIQGNFDFFEVQTPLRHLRDGVIDAWIGIFPDLPDADDPELLCLHLTRYPIRLVVDEGHPLLDLGPPISLDQVRRYPCFPLADGAFPQVQAQLEALQLWTSTSLAEDWQFAPSDPLNVAPATVFTMDLFGIKKVMLPVEIPIVSGDSLVVRREFAEHPRLQALLDHLRRKAAELAAAVPEVTCC